MMRFAIYCLSSFSKRPSIVVAKFVAIKCLCDDLL